MRNKAPRHEGIRRIGDIAPRILHFGITRCKSRSVILSGLWAGRSGIRFSAELKYFSRTLFPWEKERILFIGGKLGGFQNQSGNYEQE